MQKKIAFFFLTLVSDSGKALVGKRMTNAH